MSRCPPEDVLILHGSSTSEENESEILDGWTADTVVQHLASCDECRAVAEDVRSLSEVMRSDPLQEPVQAFWDDLAIDVMGSLDAGSDSKDGAEVVELRTRPAPDPEISSHRWALVFAAAAVVLLGAALALTVTRRNEDPTPEALVEDETAPLLLDESTARALAEELGISLDPIDPAAVAQAEVADVGASLQTGGLDILVTHLEDAETEALDIGLGDDVFAALAELDVAELAAVLETLES